MLIKCFITLFKYLRYIIYACKINKNTLRIIITNYSYSKVYKFIYIKIDLSWYSSCELYHLINNHNFEYTNNSINIQIIKSRLWSSWFWNVQLINSIIAYIIIALYIWASHIYILDQEQWYSPSILTSLVIFNHAYIYIYICMIICSISSDDFINHFKYGS